MTMPRIKAIEPFLLDEIEKAGGRVYWTKLWAPVAVRCTELTPEDRDKKRADGKKAWEYCYLKRTRDALTKAGDLKAELGYWSITKAGLDRLMAWRQSQQTVGATCACGCGGTPMRPSDYIPGHDLRHRNELIERAGGVDALTQLLDQVDAYMSGDVGESELAASIRRLHVSQ